LQSTQGIKTAKARDVRPSEAPSERPRRSWNRIGQTSDQGVWTAALATAFMAFLTPVWFLAVGTAFGSQGDGSYVRSVHAVQLATLLAGALILWGAAGSAWILARAPRIEQTGHRTMLRWCAIASVVSSVLFINCCLDSATGIASDGVAYAAAIVPSLFLAEISVALCAIARNRHGSSVGGFGGLAWMCAGAAVVLVGAMPWIWWLPLAVSTVGAYCTGMAAVRVWRRYEGRMVVA
jgi:hypothetical protein